MLTCARGAAVVPDCGHRVHQDPEHGIHYLTAIRDLRDVGVWQNRNRILPGQLREPQEEYRVPSSAMWLAKKVLADDHHRAVAVLQSGQRFPLDSMFNWFGLLWHFGYSSLVLASCRLRCGSPSATRLGDSTTQVLYSHLCMSNTLAHSTFRLSLGCVKYVNAP